jgi:hypothetical protein
MKYLCKNVFSGILCFSIHTVLLCALSVMNSITTCTLPFHGSKGRHFDSVVDHRKYTFVESFALAIFARSVSRILNPTICISEKL